LAKKTDIGQASSSRTEQVAASVKKGLALKDLAKKTDIKSARKIWT
jgi:hypothetical protein